MRLSLNLVILLPYLLSAASCTAAPRAVMPTTHRATLDHRTEIQGYPCAKGYAWYFDDGKLAQCTVAMETRFGDALIPAGSLIALLRDGRPSHVQMSRDTNVADVTCMGAGFLGTAEGASTAFYPSGKLKQCYLAGDQTVQDIPCMRGGLGGDGRRGGVMFHESGKLKACTLANDYGAQRKGDRFTASDVGLSNGRPETNERPHP